MAYMVARPKGAWEIREAIATPAGPRARTLATFRTLDSEVIERARSRASKPLTADQLRKAAHRAGAPVAATVPDRAAGELLGQIAAGRRPRPALARLLLDGLGAGGEVSASIRAASGWIGATPQRRGETLRDLLLLTDRLPPAKFTSGRRFPRLRSSPA
jgi:hypothetical protein